MFFAVFSPCNSGLKVQEIIGFRVMIRSIVHAISDHRGSAKWKYKRRDLINSAMADELTAGVTLKNLFETHEKCDTFLSHLVYHTLGVTAKSFTPSWCLTEAIRDNWTQALNNCSSDSVMDIVNYLRSPAGKPPPTVSIIGYIDSQTMAQLRTHLDRRDHNEILALALEGLISDETITYFWNLRKQWSANRLKVAQRLAASSVPTDAELFANYEFASDIVGTVSKSYATIYGTL
jgi:hypothetical protein